jgi:MAP3K TRAFs-binding domain
MSFPTGESLMDRPLCFVLLPIGEKPALASPRVDFDAVYHRLIAPAVENAGLEPLRAAQDVAEDFNLKPLFEQFMLCPFAVADLTLANAHLYYELGVRHAKRPGTTVLLYAGHEKGMPFGIETLGAIPYSLAADGAPVDVIAAGQSLTRGLEEARRALKEGAGVDRPVYEFVEEFTEVAHTKTDVFRERVRYSKEKKQQLAAARQSGLEAVREAEKSFGPIHALESAVAIDLLLSYRAVKGWLEMIALTGKMARPLTETVMVQEQLALALNRAGQGSEAERVLKTLLQRQGPSSETCAILGRVYKDRWESALKAGNGPLAGESLQKAIEAYRQGFETDWRDALPGINTVTLMELQDSPDPARFRLLPVVAYAVERRLAAGKPDYWDHATILELAVLAKEEPQAVSAAANALAAVREAWEPETTARNLRLIRETRAKRGEDLTWAREIEQALEKKAAAFRVRSCG